VLDGLVRPDAVTEDLPLVCVRHLALDGDPRETDGLGGDDDPFLVQSVEDLVKSLTFFADEVLCRYLEILEPDLVGWDGRPDVLLDLSVLDCPCASASSRLTRNRLMPSVWRSTPDSGVVLATRTM
jgi:hypothetical protein